MAQTEKTDGQVDWRAMGVGDAAMIAAMGRDWDESHGGSVAEAHQVHERDSR